MVITKPSVEMITKLDYRNAIRTIESLEKVKSNQEISISSSESEKYIKNMIKSGNLSAFEALSLSIRITSDKETAYKIEQESTIKNKETLRHFIQKEQRFKDEIIVINPGFEKKSMEYNVWRDSCLDSESAYIYLIDNGVNTNLAKRVLPNCLKTELVITMNIKEWREFLLLNLSNNEYLQVKKVIHMILELLKKEYTVFFEDINEDGK